MQLISIVNNDTIVNTEMMEIYFEQTVYPIINKYQTKSKKNCVTNEDGEPFIMALTMAAMNGKTLTRGQECWLVKMTVNSNTDSFGGGVYIKVIPWVCNLNKMVEANEVSNAKLAITITYPASTSGIIGSYESPKEIPQKSTTIIEARRALKNKIAALWYISEL